MLWPSSPVSRLASRLLGVQGGKSRGGLDDIGRGIAVMDPQELLLTAVRAVGVYALMLVVVRLLGKRTVGNFSAFDLLVALMLGEVVDEIIYGDVSIAQGAVAILAVAII